MDDIDKKIEAIEGSLNELQQRYVVDPQDIEALRISISEFVRDARTQSAAINAVELERRVEECTLELTQANTTLLSQLTSLETAEAQLQLANQALAAQLQAQLEE